MSHDDNDLQESLVEGVVFAIADKVPEGVRRAVAVAAAVALLRRLAEEVQEADEDDLLWPDSDDLLIIAGKLEDEEPGVSR